VSEKNPCIALGLLLVIVVVVFAAFAFEVTQKIIEHDCAYYHPQTGDFTWKNDRRTP
jgi:hypothetical protein